MISAVMPTYNRLDVAFDKGEGAWLWDTDGRRYLDFASGIAVTSLGHAHPHLVEALTAQAGRFWHCSNLYRIPGQERMAERLVAASFADTVFFTNSGVEAVECGIKLIRRHFAERGEPGRNRIICATNAFHGRTLATIFAAGQEKLVHGFGPAMPGFDHVPFGNLNELRQAITPETAGILVEPIQGEGGIAVASPDYMRGLRAAADEFGLLLMLDEVQTGCGRTGRLFAHEHAGMAPDVMAVAKGIGGGFPLGACLATENAAAEMTAGSHGSTYGGNPLAMAVGNAVLDIVLADGFLDGVGAIAGRLRAGLEDLVARHPGVVSEVRGLGLLLGLKAVGPNMDLLNALRAGGLLTAPAGDNVVRILPPLIIDDSHVEAALAMLERTCAALAAAGGAEPAA